MFILVKLFGLQARYAGTQEVRVEIDDGCATCGAVLRELAEAEPALAPSIDSSRLAVNQVFVEPDHRIELGDEVALIGLIGGG